MGLARGLTSGLLIACSWGCSTTATIHRSDGYMLEGRIKGGTPSSIIVDPRIGERQEIPRSQVVDIDHPGNVHALIGGIVFGLGGISAATTCSDINDHAYDRGSDCFYGVSVAIAGAAILGWGLYNWFGSTDAADDVSMRHIPDERRGPRRGLPPKKAPPRDESPPESDELPPAPPPPPGAAPPAPSSTAPPAPAPPPSASPPSEPPPGGVVW
jgi:hypothetical protein